MKKTNLEIVQETYGHFSTGNIPAVFSLLADDVKYLIPGSPDIPYAGVFEGKQAVGMFYKKLNETLQYTSFDIHSFTPDNEKVIVQGAFAGTLIPTGKPFATDWIMIWTFADGKIKQHQTFLDSNNIARGLRG
jgi:ketosteroid isomerase-like protein